MSFVLGWDRMTSVSAEATAGCRRSMHAIPTHLGMTTQVRIVNLSSPGTTVTQDGPGRFGGLLQQLRASGGLSQDELAAWSGASREAVARSLHMLRELGWIETRRREIRVLDVDALRGLIG